MACLYTGALLSNKFDFHRITVALNNCFRRVFKCWRENVRPLQFFCNILPLSYIIDQCRLLFWRPVYKSIDTVLKPVAYLNQNQFIAIASKYGMVNYSSDVKTAIWRCLSTSVF